MACKAYRDQAKAERGVEQPNMVVPETIHAAFDKAAAYFGIKLIKVPVNQQTFKADVRAMGRSINSNTIAIAGSAPSCASSSSPFFPLCAFFIVVVEMCVYSHDAIKRPSFFGSFLSSP
jgi:hypothetical protein